MKLLGRALAGWCLLLVAAVGNGALRQAVLLPRLGDAPAHALSSVMLSAVVFVLGWWLARWLGMESSRQAWRVGLLWLGLTLGFEFLGGHFLFGTPWSQLLADYNVIEGRLWILVLAMTLLTPPVVYRLRRSVPLERLQ